MEDIVVQGTDSNRSRALSTGNRIRSIQHDVQFVTKTACSLGNPPILANERCGSWYVPPALRAGSVYFKSTDGHQGKWTFSTRRLNLGLLNVLGEHGVCIVVDSTRGKTMPDALSKTIPIWAAVVNRLLFPEQGDTHGLHTPRLSVAETEHLAIESRLESLTDVAKTLPLNVQGLRDRLVHPIQIHFYSPNKTARLPQGLATSANHLICLSASEEESQFAPLGHHYAYISGAGDDAENWARGLTPELFWLHHDQLISTLAEDAVERLVDDIVSSTRQSAPAESRGDILLKPVHLAPSSPPFFVGSDAAAQVGLEKGLDVNAIVVCQNPKASQVFLRSTNVEDTGGTDKFIRHPCSGVKIPILALQCPPGKLGSRALRTELGRISPFLATHLGRAVYPRLLFACPSGADLAICVALAVACLHFDNSGSFTAVGVDKQQRQEREGKVFVRKRLVQILDQMGVDEGGGGEARSILRTTLTTVNNFVLRDTYGS